MAVLNTQKGKLDLCELCGGEARVTKLAIRRQMKVGKNFDIVCGIDLNDETVQRDAMQYFRVTDLWLQLWLQRAHRMADAPDRTS